MDNNSGRAQSSSHSKFLAQHLTEKNHKLEKHQAFSRGSSTMLRKTLEKTHAMTLP
jgi:hypothetical protein